MPQNYLDEALNQQGLKDVPNRLKQTWVENSYKYEVRIHAGESQYTNSQSIYRVSRQAIPTPGVQGIGIEYMDVNGKWWHKSVLKEFFKGGVPNPFFNPIAAAETHIPLP